MTRLQWAKIATVGLCAAHVVRHAVGPAVPEKTRPVWLLLGAAAALWFVAGKIASATGAAAARLRLSDPGRQRVVLFMRLFAASFVGMLVADRVLHSAWLGMGFWVAGFGAMLASALVAAAEHGDEAVRRYLGALAGFFLLLVWGTVSPLLTR